MSRFRRRVLLIFLIPCVAAHVAAAPDSSRASPASESAKPHKIEVVELAEVLRPGASPLPPGAYRLARDFIGTLTSVRDEQAKLKLREGAATPIRFNFLFVGKKGELLLVSAATNAHGVPTMHSLGFRMSPRLHSTEEVLVTRLLPTLQTWYGKQHGLTDAWGSMEDIHWTEQWCFFARNPDDTITCRNIFAHISQKRKTEPDPSAKGPFKVKILSSEPARVDLFDLSQGVFRPASSNDAEELKAFPSENEKEARRRAEEVARIDANPEPLRALLHAKHTPGDHDLVAYKAAINRFRAKPDAELVSRLVARLNDGTCEMKMLLEALFDDGDWLKTEPWKLENKRAALRALMMALPAAPDYHAEEVVLIILSETGLVSLKMDTPGFGIETSAEPRRPNSAGYGGCCGALRIKVGFDRKRALSQVRDELLRRWEADGFPVERYASPTAAE